ncbi:glutamate cyclase domain-containing protein [Paraburkholderia sp. HD33-4]|uniref:glutamate cyclase domain-containing protein n=1 Tax=Paraburkholderia sp. HD33-4 TaxID=2883242 RepID=UPI001F283F4F|nr:glutamate cyclase domain-containing protein [Paraburkholderia sp. HD33-4]
MTTASFAPIDERLDSLVSLDLGGRGVEQLYAAARKRQGGPLVGAAADALAAIPDKANVFVTTGSVSRAWVSPCIGENDGPAGLAVVVRALSLAKKALCITFVEETLIPTTSAILTTAGLTVLPYEQAKIARDDGSLAVVCVEPFPLDEAGAKDVSRSLIDKYQPALFFSTERVGRNVDGVYCSMRGVDYGMGRARIDFLFDEAIAQKIPTVAVGDGGNEIGMSVVSEAVQRYVKFGDKRPDGSAGIGAVTGTDVLVTAACSNWGCYAIAGAFAARMGKTTLAHSPVLEAALLRRGVDVGLINSVANVIDSNVDGIPEATHMAVVQLISTIIAPAFK